MTLMNSISRLARSPQGKRLARRAVDAAKDPKTRRQIEEARRKLAERRGKGGGHGYR